MEKMKAYFSVIKRLQPQVCEEASSILTRYYQLQRQSDGRNSARTTIRMLESLSRLAEGEDGILIWSLLGHFEINLNLKLVDLELTSVFEGDLWVAVTSYTCLIVNFLLFSFLFKHCQFYHRVFLKIRFMLGLHR